MLLAVCDYVAVTFNKILFQIDFFIKHLRNIKLMFGSERLTEGSEKENTLVKSNFQHFILE